MFEKFTEKAKRILFLARYEASQQGAKTIESEHILLGLLKEGEETTRELFSRANVSMDLLQAELEERGSSQKLSTSVEIPFSPGTKDLLQHAERESERMMHPHIGTEHILLGILHMAQSTAGRMLLERGMRLDAVREDAMNIHKRRALPKKKKGNPVPQRVLPRSVGAGRAPPLRPADRPGLRTGARRPGALPAAGRTTRCCWASPAWARPPSSRASPLGSSTAKSRPRCCTSGSWRWTCRWSWPARSTAASSRSGSRASSPS